MRCKQVRDADWPPSPWRCAIPSVWRTGSRLHRKTESSGDVPRDRTGWPDSFPSRPCTWKPPWIGRCDTPARPSRCPRRPPSCSCPFPAPPKTGCGTPASVACTVPIRGQRRGQRRLFPILMVHPQYVVLVQIVVVSTRRKVSTPARRGTFQVRRGRPGKRARGQNCPPHDATGVSRPAVSSSCAGR
jgi:hypothetical protein